MWAKTIEAYAGDRAPDIVHRANFFTPSDFAASASYRNVAYRCKGDAGWTRIMPN